MRLILLILACFLAAQVTAQPVAVDYYSWRSFRAPGAASGILVDPANDEIWYVSSPNGLFITRNGGDAWSQVLTGDVAPEAVLIDPVNASRLYAVADGTLFASSDKGVSWMQRYKFSSQIVSLALSPPMRLYAGPRFAEDFSGIYRSTDRGESFNKIPFGSSTVTPSAVRDIEVDLNGCLYVTAESVSAGVGSLLQSCNSGSTWSSILGMLHCASHKVAFEPGEPVPLRGWSAPRPGLD
jgi:photosystem II stability/assembly factor-like uncharacterized protein